MTATATTDYAPAQVGNGRTAHLTDANAFSTDTLCGRTVTRVLNGLDAAKKKPCVKCAQAAQEAAAQVEETPEAEEAQVEETAPVAEVEETEEAAGEEEPAEVEEPAAVEPAGQVEVTAYTAAVEQLYLNGQDSSDRTLSLDAQALAETLPTLRRMPRWNAAQERFTVNKVALILVQDATGSRVWVRGEAEPFRVDLAGAPVAEDAPAETGPVDMKAIMTATRVLRRRREVQRVIDNREAARATTAPTA